MPELPEVETVARDLRPRILGATITGARVSWARTLRTHTPESFGEAIAGRRVEAVWRRAKQIVIDLSGDAALTIHLKMTGQLFVVPAETPVDPYVRLVLELADGREVRFRDIRKFGKIGLYGRDPVTGELVTEVGGGAVFATLGPEPLDPAFSVRDFRRRLRKRSGRLKPLLLDQSFIAGVGNIYADEALWAARLHPLRTAGTLRPPDERHLYDEVRRILAEAVVRRGSSIDDYTAPDGDGSMQEHLQVYQRTGEPCPRCGRPVKRIVIGARSTHFCSWCQRLGAGDRKGAAAILRTMTGGPRRSGGRWTDLAGEGTVGLTPQEAARASSRARTERTKRAAATRRAAARASAPVRTTGCRPMSILRLTGVTREVGTFVILDAIDASIALGDRIGLVGPNGAGKTTLLRLAAGRDEPDRGEVHRKRGLTLGLLAQEAHFDEAFMASPDLRTAVRTGAAHLDRMAERLAAMEREERVTDHAYAELLHQYEILGGYTLDQRVESALSGLGFTRDEWAKPPSALSGGEQTRASLARLVIADPDLLLLDEPTNHLDLDALEWLEEHLRRRAGSLLVASHDRAFLDATVDRVWELRDRKLTAFRGDYSAYHRQRIERDARTVKDVDTQAEQIAREKELIQRYRSHRKFSKQARARGPARKARGGAARCPQGRAEAGDPDRRADRWHGAVAQRRDRRARRGPRGRLPPGARRDGADGSPATDAKVVARAPFLAAQRGERIGIVGPNGAGKTTLLRTIAGDLPPLDGSITFGNAVQIGYLAQLRSAGIAGTTVLDALTGGGARHGRGGAGVPGALPVPR